MNLAWKFQIPAFIMSDKTLSEGTYSVDPAAVTENRSGDSPRWDGTSPYLRYADVPNGISPLAFPGMKDAVIKTNCYAHDEAGITTEDAPMVARMAKKRLRKGELLAEEIRGYSCINISGIPDASTALFCWGSTKGVCNEIAALLGLRVIRPVVLSPFPVDQLKKTLDGVGKLIAVEENATAQLAILAERYGIIANGKILQYDGRPFLPDDLLVKVKEMIV
jgi:2-oxoglutarate ferredoxin oxidoreductase subunit alpha